MIKVWKIKKQLYKDEIDQLLYNRGIIKNNRSSKERESFLNPKFDRDLCDATLLPDYQKFEDAIALAVKSKEKIGIFADYDADGIPGAAFLYKTLQKLKVPVEIFLPSRQSGYGLNKEGIDSLFSKGCRLIITVDLGIKDIENAIYCKKLGIKLIITDHHLPGEELPKAFAVINPKIASSHYPFPDLCGAGVIYKLVSGLQRIFPKIINDAFLKWNLDLIAISTISDMVPLVGENRVIAKFGLIALQRSRNLGLNKIYEVAAINPKNINAYSVGFQIGPRLNAPGRIEKANQSFELLTTDDEDDARRFAKFLEEKNSERQIFMDEVEEEAIDQIIKKELSKNKIIVVKGDWPKGVIGPTASRLVEKFYRPTVLLTADGEYLSGSARSIKGVSIIDLLSSVEKLLVTFGGHHGAAGVKIKKSNFNTFHSQLKLVAEKKIAAKYLQPQAEIDLLARPERISLALITEIQKLEPFGLGNPRPVFMLNKVNAIGWQAVGRENQHLKITVLTDKIIFDAIYFQAEKRSVKLEKEKYYDIIFTPTINDWNNAQKISLNIIDIRDHYEEK